MTEGVDLYGRIFVTGKIRAVTGLHIGGSRSALTIGGVENAVIRNALTNCPYIPGSSLKGKMRSLWEKMTGAEQNWSLTRGRRVKAGQRRPKEVVIHLCHTKEEYGDCPVCQIYGVMGQSEASFPTRLVVRDVLLGEAEAERLDREAHTDLPYTEVKYEVAIDRVTSAAVPRPMERVPAGVVFDGFELVFSVYAEGDLGRFLNVLEAMQLLEDDYLGGQGSRGSGKIMFQELTVSCRARNSYGHKQQWEDIPRPNEAEESQVAGILLKQHRDALLGWLKDRILFEGYRLAEK
jgi:CRISPR-associated protein Csm3